jgi:hypothetical protein
MFPSVRGQDRCGLIFGWILLPGDVTFSTEKLIGQRDALTFF